MGDVAVSANDPIFLNHHAMIDYIFEEWLKKGNGAYLPMSLTGTEDDESDTLKGHRENDVIVPFIPLYTNGQMFKIASEFGYEYVVNPTVSPGGNGGGGGGGGGGDSGTTGK